MNRKIVMRAVLVLAAALVLVQFVPVDRTNPPLGGEVPAPPEVRAILKRACYDCHSNETVWPWYGRVAPFDWLMERDVREGRREVNFSTLADAPLKRRQRKWMEIPEQVEKNEMPPWFYTAVHPEARLSDADRTALVQWAQENGRRDGPPAPPPAR
ncbi:MAG TPA: heme-binding domain-containing protein [Thermoanaerobaculia bacterium]|nr:heme-binding domain-containing protein [Thermoanaerobaculia bacterium]